MEQKLLEGDEPGRDPRRALRSSKDLGYAGCRMCRAGCRSDLQGGPLATARQFLCVHEGLWEINDTALSSSGWILLIERVILVLHDETPVLMAIADRSTMYRHKPEGIACV